MTDQSSWAKGYAAGKESLRAELEWCRAEVLRLRENLESVLTRRGAPENDEVMRLRYAQKTLRRIINHWDEFGFEHGLDREIEQARPYSLAVDSETDREHDPTVAPSDDAEFGMKP